MATLKKVKGTVLVKNIQGNEFGVLKTKIDKKNVTLRFLTSGLPKNTQNGSTITGTLVKQHCDGLNLDMVVNVSKVSGVKVKNVKMAKGSGKKKGHITSVNPSTQSRTILSDDGYDFIDYGTTWFPVGKEVTFKNSGIVDSATGLLIATDVTAV